MLTILDLLNHYLGFFNVNTKWKGQVYTILASVGNFYVLYLAIMHLKNAAYLRGLGLLLSFIVIAYFAFLNVVYYFTKKTFKWDLSPQVEKLLGGKPADADKTQRQATPFVPANGLYGRQHVLPASAVTDPDMQAELTKVAEQLQSNGLMTQDYGGLSEDEQMAYLAADHDVIYANHPGTPLPYFRLEKERGGLAIYGGLNEMLAQRLARIETVGLQPVALAMESYELFVASAVILGGEGKVRGRANLQTRHDDYHLGIELAYKAKEL